jgi:dolichol-phosphate mannosyltransferase
MPFLSVVVPVFNERDNVLPLIAEITAALRGKVDFEIVYVDDASRDDTVSILKAAKAANPELRVLQHHTQSGQSTAIRNGVKAARGEWIATLDGDGQNDPADIPKLLAMRNESSESIKLFAGWRVNRQDSGSKRWASKWANAIRSRLLKDETPDTGCGIKLFERAAFLDLPYFDHMHRYLPALMQRAGWQVKSVPVNHRARSAGSSKYNNLNRALVGIADLRGQADNEVIKRLLAITDSRFQDELLATAKANGKLETEYQIPQSCRRNLPEILERCLGGAATRTLLPDFPFGTDFTEDELVIVRSLARLKRSVEHPADLVATLVKSAIGQLLDSETVPERYLERMGMTEAHTLKDKLMRTLFVGNL